MASGKAHSRIAHGVTWVMALVSVTVAGMGHSAEALFIFTGSLLGWLITPDIDIPHRTHEEMRLWKVSPVLGLFWQKYWYAYALLIPHRHWLSHLPGVGTVLRMAYALWWLPLVVDVPWMILGWVAVGWTVQDVVHLAADGWWMKT